MKSNFLLSMVILLLLGFGCKKDEKPSSIMPIQISEGSLSGTGIEGINKQEIVITQDEEWEQLIQAMDKVNDVTRNFVKTDVDFSKYQIIAVFEEIKPHDGYEIEISHIREYESKIVVSVIYKKLKIVVHPVLTQPYHIVETPAFIGKNIVFEYKYID